MKRQLINPEHTRSMYDRNHFSQAVRVGDMIWVSGQVGIEPATMKAAEGMEAQTRLAFEGVKTVLETAGASLADIVEITTFHTDLRGEIGDFVRIKDQYLPGRYPAWSAVGVTQLAFPDLLVEIRVVAAAGSGND